MIPLLVLLLLAGQEPDAAARAYREGRHADAAAAYRLALEAGDGAAGALHYNLGNCAYRLGQHAEAVLHYRRAGRWLRDDADLRWNLQQALAQLGITAPEPAPLLPRSAWLLLAALLQGLGLGAAVWLRRPRWLLLVLPGLACAWPELQRQLLPPPPAAVVLAATVDLHGGPTAAATPSGRLTAGETVAVRGQQPGWLRVEHPRASGWLRRDAVGLVD